MKLALFGYGGHAREVACQMKKEVTFFVDDQYANDIANPISKFNPEEYLMMIAVADSKSRFEIHKKMPNKTRYFTYIHPTTLMLDDQIQIGEGSFIGAYSILTTNIQIGNHAILNRGNHIGHDCSIGDYFSAMPNSVVGGNVLIEDRVYMGSCSNVREKIKISSDCIIGMNAAVVSNIDEPGTYAGVPANKIK